MKNIRFILLTIALVVVCSIKINSQTLDEIISKNTQAMGGKKIVKSITSIYMENAIEVMGNESTSTITILKGKGAKTINDFDGQSMIQCYTDKGGWAINPMSGGSDATVMPENQYKNGKNQIYISRSLWDFVEQKGNLELLGKEKLNNSDVFRIKITTSDSISIINYVDATSFFIVQTNTSGDMMGQQTEIITKLSDYEKTESGYSLPKTTNISFGDQFSLVIKLKKAEINVPVDPAIFELGNLKSL